MTVGEAISVPEDHARVAYDALAPAYDVLTGEHDHERWTGLVEERAHAVGLQGKRLLDVACGTGNTIVPMLARGYDVTGVDISAAMLEEAQRKTRGRARLEVADMRALPVLGQFDLVWSLHDSLNYLHARSELVSTLAGIRRNLAPGGIVVFDVNTLATFRRLASSILAVPRPDRIVLVEGRGEGDLRSGDAVMSGIDRLERGASGFWRRIRTDHHQRHHPELDL